MELPHCPKTMKKKSSHTLVLDNLILLITVDLELHLNLWKLQDSNLWLWKEFYSVLNNKHLNLQDIVTWIVLLLFNIVSQENNKSII